MKKPWLNDPIIQISLSKRKDQRIIHVYPDGSMSSDIRNAMVDSFSKYMASEEWNAVGKEVIKRDKGVCQNCGTKGKKSKVVWYIHHTDYRHFAKANYEEIADCILLCKRCHDKIHSSSDMQKKVPFWAQQKHVERYMCGEYLTQVIMQNPI